MTLSLDRKNKLTHDPIKLIVTYERFEMIHQKQRTMLLYHCRCVWHIDRFGKKKILVRDYIIE